MATLGEVYAALADYRVELQQQRFHAGAYDTAMLAESAGVSAQAAAAPLAAFSSPLTNVHATGVGVRVRGGAVVPDEFVIKVYVFNKVDLGAATPDLTRQFGSIPVDVEPLPVQLALALARAAKKAAAKKSAAQKGAPALAAGIPPNRRKVRPIVGGVSIAPLNAAFVGTLGCFVKRRVAGVEQVFVLSNNHVLADVNSLPIGTVIVQPGPETAPTTPADGFASLSAFIPIRFPQDRFHIPTNRFDAAIAQVSDLGAIKRGNILGIGNFATQIAAPQPGMRVTKSGRTTGVTTGVVTAVNVNNVQVNYGTQSNPRIASFNETVQIVGDDGRPFSAPGDSGSVILDRGSKKPVALLFAGDGRATTACSFAGVCRDFNVMPA